MAHYHCDINVGTKGEGRSQVAMSHYAYICREGVFGKLRSPEEKVLVVSGNMPKWAQDDPSVFWLASDEFERENGSVYRELEGALPRELPLELQKQIIEAFLERVLAQHAYTYAIHIKPASDGEMQPHVHLMWSERIQDGIERSADLYFKRVASARKRKDGTVGEVDPAKGGCRKDSMHPRLAEFRELWATVTNEAYTRAGIDLRVDHRSLADQGIEREPTRHVGPGRRELAEEALREQEDAERRALEAIAAGEALALLDKVTVPVLAPVRAPTPVVPDFAAERLIQRLRITSHEPPRRLPHWPEPPPRYPRRPADAEPFNATRPLKHLEDLIDAFLPPRPAPRRGGPRPRAYDPDADSAGRRRARVRKPIEGYSRWQAARVQMLRELYGGSSDYIAAFWFIQKHPRCGEVEFKHKGGRIVDKGASIVADHGTASEVQAMIELAKVKRWSSIVFTGDDAFKLRAMVRALDERLNVQTTTDHDAEILKRAQAIVGGDNDGGGHNENRPRVGPR